MRLQSLHEALSEASAEIASMHDMCGKGEKSLENHLYTLLGAQTDDFVVSGLFGWGEHKADRLLTVGASQFVCECKKVTETSEYGYWHALVQAQIYSYRNQNFPVVCIVFDWGRLAGRNLEPSDSGFLLPWIERDIYFIRISLSGRHFIEHDLNGAWEELR